MPHQLNYIATEFLYPTLKGVNMKNSTRIEWDEANQNVNSIKCVMRCFFLSLYWGNVNLAQHFYIVYAHSQYDS